MSLQANEEAIRMAMETTKEAIRRYHADPDTYGYEYIRITAMVLLEEGDLQ